MITKFISEELDQRIEAFWSMIEKAEGVSSPYLNNIELHSVEALNAETAEVGGADKYAKSCGFDSAEHMMMCVLSQAEEDYECKTLEWAKKTTTADQLSALAAHMDTITTDARINAHNDLCDLAKAPQHLYAGEELDLTVCFNRKHFERLQQQLNDFINKETPRYFKTNTLYKVSKSGFVQRWSITRGWLDCTFSIVDLINFGGKEITETEFNATISSDRATISTKGDLWYVMVDCKHLYEFDNEYDAVEYAQRVNAN